MKRLLLISFAIILVIGVSGCGKSSPATKDQDSRATSTYGSVVTTSTTSAGVVSSTPILPTTTSSNISTWNRFKFFELGFSIKLPFETSLITSAYQEDARKAMYWYKGYVKNKSGDYNFLGSVSENYRDGTWKLTEISTLTKTGDTYKIGDVEIHPLKIVPLSGGRLVVIFDANKDFYRWTEADYGKAAGQRYGAVFVLSTSKKFKAALLEFKTDDLTLDQLSEAAGSIEFFSRNEGDVPSKNSSVTPAVIPVTTKTPPQPKTPYVFASDQGTNPAVCSDEPQGGAYSKWVYNCTRRSVFNEGDAVYSMIRLNKVFRNYRIKAQMYRDGIYQREEISTWSDINTTWGSDKIYYWVTMGNVRGGKWEVWYFVDTGNGFSSTPLARSVFSVVGSGSSSTLEPSSPVPSTAQPAPYVFNSLNGSNPKVCATEPVGGAYSNWVYTCTGQTHFETGTDVYGLIRLDKVYKNYKIRVRLYKNNVYVLDHLSPWQEGDSVWGKEKVYFWVRQSNMSEGSWRFEYFVDVGSGFTTTPVAVNYFNVSSKTSNAPVSRADYKYYGQARTCDNSTVQYGCGAARTVYTAGENVRAQVMLSDIFIDHAFKVEVFKNGVFQWDYTTPVNYVDKVNGWNTSYFNPLVSSVTPGNWSLRTYVVTSEYGTQFLETLNFTVN